MAGYGGLTRLITGFGDYVGVFFIVTLNGNVYPKLKFSFIFYCIANVIIYYFQYIFIIMLISFKMLLLRESLYFVPNIIFSQMLLRI